MKDFVEDLKTRESLDEAQHNLTIANLSDAGSEIIFENLSQAEL